MELFKVIFTILTLPFVKCVMFELKTSNIRVEFDGTGEDHRLRINFYASDKQLLQRIILDEDFDADTEITSGSDQFTLRGRNNHKLEITFRDQNFQFTRYLRFGEKSQDCFYLNSGHVNWYGGLEDPHQHWPIEKSTFQNYSYVITKENICHIPRRHWLNSRGVAILPEITVPLFIDQNTREKENQLCFTAALQPPYENNEIYKDYRDLLKFSYEVIIAKNMRIAHMKALELIGKPTLLFDETVIRYPTWALHRNDINEEILGVFLNDIVENGFNYGLVLVEVEDAWKMNISSLQNVIRLMDELGLRMTFLLHSISDLNLFEAHRYVFQRMLTTNDLNNPDSRELLRKLENLMDIQSYKFDVKVPEYKIYLNSRTIEVIKRRGTPPILYRLQCHQFNVQMMDKDNLWTYNNGLPTLITTLLQMNIAGYPFVVPAMIGGNKYNNPPDKELFIRWMQATVFMPSMQFSYFPWLYDQETVELTKKFVDLHKTWADYIVDRFNISLQTGEPVNPPLWWLDSGDVVARQIQDQFLLGDKVIVAPVLVQGQTERDIYLPTGTWRDGNTQEIERGPKWLLSYPAPLTVLPYFYKD